MRQPWMWNLEKEYTLHMNYAVMYANILGRNFDCELWENRDHAVVKGARNHHKNLARSLFSLDIRDVPFFIRLSHKIGLKGDRT